MEAKDKLDKIYSRLDSYKPEPEDRSGMIRNIMDRTSESNTEQSIGKIMNILFGWTEILWVRRGLITISMGLIFVLSFSSLVL